MRFIVAFVALLILGLLPGIVVEALDRAPLVVVGLVVAGACWWRR